MSTAQATETSRLVDFNGLLTTPEQFTSLELLKAGLFPEQLDLVLQAAKQPNPLNFRFVTRKIITNSGWIGPINDPNEGELIIPGQGFYRVNTPERRVAISAIEDLVAHNTNVAKEAHRLCRIMLELDPDVLFYLSHHPSAPEDSGLRLLSDRQGEVHDIGKFSLLIPWLVGGLNDNIQLKKEGHGLLAMAIADVLSNSLTAEDIDNFMVPGAHHWLFQRYPNFVKLFQFRNYHTIIPKAIKALGSLINVERGIRLSEILLHTLDTNDHELISVFIGAMKAMYTNVADTYVGMLEENREYQKGREPKTPEQALEIVSGLISEKGLPEPMLKAFIIFALNQNFSQIAPHVVDQRFIIKLLDQRRETFVLEMPHIVFKEREVAA